MHFSRRGADTVSTVVAATLLLSSLPLVSAVVFPRLVSSASPLLEATPDLEARDCANPCGYYNQLCCQSNQVCYTDANNEAQCGDAGAGSGWQLFTTTYVVSELDTITTVYSSPMAAASPHPAVVTVTVAAPGGVCNVQLGQTTCGSTCCGAGAFCNNGMCQPVGGTTPAAGGGGGQATITAAIRPTSISTFTVITTGGVTTTVPYLAPATATAGMISEQSTGSHLSGGAIAGIVIGVLAGIILLILLVICCCARGLLDLIRPKRKTEVTEVYAAGHHASGSNTGNRRRFPFFGGGGGGGGGNAQAEGKKGRGWLGVASVLAALAIILGLKRRRERREEEEKESTAYTYSEYTYSYSDTSASSASSDRRSRGTRITRGSRR